MSAYRDELEAARARAEELEERLIAQEAELAEFRRRSEQAFEGREPHRLENVRRSVRIAAVVTAGVGFLVGSSLGREEARSPERAAAEQVGTAAAPELAFLDS